MNERVQQLRQLTDEERQQARYAAREVVIPPQPKRSDFENRSTQKYSSKLIKLALVLIIMMFIAAFTPSAIRLYQAAWDIFSQINIPGFIGETPVKDIVAVIASIATVATADIGQVVFFLSISVLLTKEEITASRVLWAGAIISTLIAVLGNMYTAFKEQTNLLDYITKHPWQAIEALAPTILIMITGYAIKYWALRRNEQAFEAEKKYQEDMKHWEALSRNPEVDPRFVQFYANKIMEYLYNRQGSMRGKKQLWSELTNDEKNWLVHREFAAEKWLESPNPQPPLAQ